MKKLLALVLSLCMVFSLCATAFAEDAVSLTVWVGDNQDQPWIDGVIASFKAANPELNIDFQVGIQTEGEAKATVLTDVQAAADVFTFADDQLPELVAAGALQEVNNADAVIEANGGAGSGSVAAASFNGTLYAYPATASNGYFMFYNKEYFTEDDVKSLDKMLEVAAAAGKKVGFPMANGWYVYSFFKGAGLEMAMNADNTANTCNWNATDTAFTGVQVLQGLLDIAKNPGFLDADSDPFVTGVKDGSIIAGVSGTWNANTAAETWGDNYAATKLPTFTVNGEQVQMSSFAGYKLVGVNAYSENVGYAMMFAEYMTNYESQMSRFEIRSEGPSNAQAAASDAVQANPAIAALAAQAAYAYPQQVANPYWASAETLGKLIVNGNPDGTDLQTLLDNAVAGITTPITQ